MNISTIALIFVVWQLLSKRSGNTPQTPDLKQFLSDDTKSILDCVGKLSDKNCPDEDKTGALFQMFTNPTVMQFAGNFFSNFGAQNDATQQTQAENPQRQQGANGDPSEQSREFFRPIDNIADEEIKHKLYWFYDNWYL